MQHDHHGKDVTLPEAQQPEAQAAGKQEAQSFPRCKWKGEDGTGVVPSQAVGQDPLGKADGCLLDGFRHLLPESRPG